MREWLIALRKAQGWTQAQLAEAAGIAPNYVCLIETGQRKVPVWTAKKIAAVLGVRVDDIFVPEPGELPKPFYVQEDYRNGRTGNNHPTDQRAVNADGGKEAAKTAGSDSRIHRRLKK